MQDWPIIGKVKCVSSLTGFKMAVLRLVQKLNVYGVFCSVLDGLDNSDLFGTFNHLNWKMESSSS